MPSARALLLTIIACFSMLLHAEDAGSKPASDDVRKAAYEAIKAALGKGPIKNVPWSMGAASEKAVFDKLDEQSQTLHANFSGMDLDLKWQKIDNVQASTILRAVGWAGDVFDSETVALSAALLQADGHADAATALLDKAEMKDAKVLGCYEALIKKYNIQAPAKPAPVPISTGVTPAGNVGSSPAPAGPPCAWESSGLSGGGSMFSPAISPVDPKMIMVNCDMGSAYITYDGGLKWRMIHYSQLRSNTRCKPAFHPTDINTIFASAGWTGMKVSRDRGEHWENVAGADGALRGEIAIDPGNPALMLAGATDCVWRSLDGGASWKKISGVQGEVLGIHFDQTSAAEKRTCIVATQSGIFRSDDAGATWSDKTKGLPSKEIVCFAGASKDKVVMLYCAVPSKNDGGKFAGGVYRSADRGENWESAMGTGINMDTKAADQWSMGPLPQYKQVIAGNAKPNTVYAFNTNTGIYPPHQTAAFRSDDAGKSWQPTFFPDQRFKNLNVAHDYMTVPCGQFFQAEAYGAAIAQSNPDICLQVDAGRCFITTDGGKNWASAHTTPAPGAVPPDKKTTWLSNGLVVTSTWNYYVDPSEPNRHYICYTDIGFATSLDAGKSWQWWGSGAHAPWENTCYELAIDPKVPGKIWGAFSEIHDIPNGNIINGGHNPNGAGGICVSADFAQSWKTSNSGLPLAPALGIALDPSSPAGNRTLYAGIFGQGVFKSTDDGKTWTKKSQGLGGADMRVSRVLIHADGTLFAVVTALRNGGKFVSDGPGIYRSKDKAETWEKVNTTQQFLWPKDLTPDPKDSKILYVGAADADDQSGGLWRTLDGGATWKRILRQGSQHFGAYFHPKRPGWIYATLAEGAHTSGLWLSKNNGDTFTAISDLPFSTVQRVAFDPAKDNVIYAVTFGGSIWKGPAE